MLGAVTQEVDTSGRLRADLARARASQGTDVIEGLLKPTETIVDRFLACIQHS